MLRLTRSRQEVERALIGVRASIVDLPTDIDNDQQSLRDQEQEGGGHKEQQSLLARLYSATEAPPRRLAFARGQLCVVIIVARDPHEQRRSAAERARGTVRLGREGELGGPARRWPGGRHEGREPGGECEHGCLGAQHQSRH
eukprot:scaffold65812_cov63-Phaeocystis_antarctica.AAC.2